MNRLRQSYIACLLGLSSLAFAAPIVSNSEKPASASVSSVTTTQSSFAQSRPAQASAAQASPAQATPTQASSAQASSAQASAAQASPAQASPAQASAAQAPQFQPGPPPGFGAAVLDQQQTTLVSVYYGGQFLGNFMASFTNTWIQFQNPQEVQNAVIGWENPKAVEPDFAKQLPTHPELLCGFDQPRPDPRSNLCSSLMPKTIAVSMDPNNYKVYLFVNPALLKPQSLLTPTLGPSSVDFSAMNAVNMAVQAESRTMSINESNNISVADHENQFVFQNALAYAHSPGVDPQDTGSFSINQFSYGRVINQKDLLQLGLLTTTGDQFISSEPIFGGEWQNSYWSNTGMQQSLQSPQGTPVYVDLVMPSQVSLYRGSELLYSTHLGVGRQQVNTNSLPIGSYMVTVKMTNSLGQTTQQQVYFVKQQSLLSQDYQYSLLVGAQSSTSGFAGPSSASAFSISVPHFVNQPLVNYQGALTLSHDLGLTETFLSNLHSLFASTQLNWYLPYQINLDLGGLLSNAQTTGLSGGVSWNGSDLSAAINGSESFWNTSPDQIEERIENPGTYFYPLSAQKYNLSSNVGLFGLGLGYTLSEVAGSGIQRTGTATYSMSLYQGGSSNLMMILMLSKDETQWSGTLTLNYTLYTPSGWSGLLSYGYSQSHSEGAPTAISRSSQLSVSRNMQLSSNRFLTAGGQISSNQGVQQLSLNGAYVSDNVNAQMSYAQTLPLNQYPASFSGSLASNLVYAKHHFGFGYSTNQWFSGVLIRVSSPVEARVAVYVDGRRVTVIDTNVNEPVFLNPYHAYQISIVPLGSTLLSYDPAPRTVTLYQGNVASLDWTLGQQYLLFAQLEDEQHKPLDNWLLVGAHEFDTTDSSGFLQATVTTDQKTLLFKNIEGHACQVTLPASLDIKNQISVLKTPLICHAIPKNPSAPIKKKPS